MLTIRKIGINFIPALMLPFLTVETIMAEIEDVIDNAMYANFLNSSAVIPLPPPFSNVFELTVDIVEKSILLVTSAITMTIL